MWMDTISDDIIIDNKDTSARKKMNILVMGNDHVVMAYMSGEENERIYLFII